MNESTEKVKCLRQIGKGSFSNVYLFENEQFSESLIGYESLLFSCASIGESKKRKGNGIAETQYFIIKEIDLSKLVYKYLSKKQEKNGSFRLKAVVSQDAPQSSVATRGIAIKQNYVWNTASVNITPYSHQPAVGIDITAGISEEDYYFSKLRELIEGEIIILKNLDNENVIKYYSSSVTNDVYSIKMEFCNLGDLYSILKEKKHILSENDKYDLKKYRNHFKGFNNKFIKKFLIDTLQGLKYIHDKNIIHRDIKLHNFLVNKGGKGNDLTFKISDFGFSCYDLSEEPLSEDSTLSSFMNVDINSIKKKYYKLCGTPYYMAPEMLMNLDKFEQLLPSNCSDIDSQKFDIAQKRVYNKKIDLWSFGICLYELIFNILPFSNMSGINDLKIFYSNKSTQSIIYKNIQETSIDNQMKIILKQLLTINPDDRISTDELLKLVYKLSDDDTYNENHLSKEKISSINMDSWLVEDFNNQSIFINSDINENWDTIDSGKIEDVTIEKSFKNLTLSVDNNFIKWLGLKEETTKK
jgi:serine/threonine protein kinase